MKKIVTLLLITIIICGVPFAHIAQAVETAEAKRVQSVFFLDEKPVNFHAYDIEKEIYVNLFEAATVLSGTAKEFSLAWGAGGKTLKIVSDRAYKAIGVNKAGAYADTVIAKQAHITVLLDGEEIELTSFSINNDVYFNLKQFAKALDFNVVTGFDEDTVELVTGSPYEELPIYKRGIDPSLPMIALTFDDGPVRFTNQILDILEKHEVVATFYVIGSQVKKEEETILRAVELGNEIGNHTMNHRNLAKQSDEGIRRQIVDANSVIESVTGVAPRTMRPPFGEINASVRNGMAWLGIPIIFWSIDPLDWLTLNADTTYTRIMNQVRDGDIILLHDTHAPTVSATARLVPALIEKGYQFVTVSELFEYREVNPVSGRVYSAVRP